MLKVMYAARALAASLLMLVPPAAAAEEAGVMAHIASYSSRETAEKGWRWAADRYSSVLYFKPEFRIVDLDGKGRFFRLYAVGDEEMVRLLCDSLKRRKSYCVLHDARSLAPVK